MKFYSFCRCGFSLLLCIVFGCIFFAPVFASGEGADFEKHGDVSIVYLFVAIVAVALVVIYLLRDKSRKPKFLVLYCCVAIANCGYFLLSAAGSLEIALTANRISYFGCAYAILMMLLIVVDVCGIVLHKAVRGVLIAVATVAFLLAASGGLLTIYYSSVSLEVINGTTRLVKCYGPLHMLYVIYVVGYFLLMVGFIVYAKLTNRISSTKYAVFLAVVVLGNIGVWVVEQVINVDFEFLSISYIATEVLLLLMSGVLKDYDEVRSSLMTKSMDFDGEEARLPPNIEELFHDFSQRVATLTPTERMVLQYYIEGCTLEEVASRAYISINTAKKHNTNLNRKLEVRSREELILYIDLFRRANRLDEIAYIR